jgi:G:T-mismatch repair DNA endonuclease (very short patch repair protein)
MPRIYVCKYDWSDLRELYCEKLLSINKIAEIKHCGDTALVLYHLRKLNIKPRSLSESVKIMWDSLSVEKKGSRAEKTALKLRGRHLSAEHLANIKDNSYAWNKGIPRTDVEKQHIREAVKNGLAKMSPAKKIEMNTKRNIAQKGKTHFELHPEVARQCGINFWKDPEKARRIAWKRPTKPERSLDRLLSINFPGQWKYVGDGQTRFGGKCPDFINVNGKKQLIEIFGIHWHDIFDVSRRIDHFNQFGFATLVIWEDELKNEIALIDKIKHFGKAKHESYR